MPSYNYFSGANVLIRVGGQPILEVAGISYQESDSQMPIYGYGSRYFDAVAPGQKIIRGNFVINFVRPDYLAYAIARGRDIEATGVAGYNGKVDTKELLNIKEELNTSRANSHIKNKGNTGVYETSEDTYRAMEDEAARKAIQSLGQAEWNKLSDEDKVKAVQQEGGGEAWIENRGKEIWDTLNAEGKSKYLKLEANIRKPYSNLQTTSCNIDTIAVRAIEGNINLFKRT